MNVFFSSIEPATGQLMIHGINVQAVGSGQTIYEDSLKRLVKQPIKDFFTTNENIPKNVIACIGELAQQTDCVYFEENVTP